MTVTPPPAQRWRVHRVVAELDAGGEIDAHAAMCLHQAIGDARASAIEMVLVDLRDLTAIDPAGVALLSAHHVDCQAHGVDLGLLIGRGEGHAQITEALVLAGLGATLRFSAEPGVPDRNGSRLRASPRRRRVLRAARVSLHRHRPSRTA